MGFCNTDYFALDWIANYYLNWRGGREMGICIIVLGGRSVTLIYDWSVVGQVGDRQTLDTLRVLARLELLPTALD